MIQHSLTLISRPNFDGKTLFGVSPVYEKQRWEDYALQESLEQRGGEGC